MSAWLFDPTKVMLSGEAVDDLAFFAPRTEPRGQFVRSGIGVSNALAFSPDGTTMYWGDTLRDTVHPNELGNFLITELVKPHLRYRPDLPINQMRNLVQDISIGEDDPPGLMSLTSAQVWAWR